MTTFGDTRTMKEKAYDRQVKARVQAGIALLKEKYGPDWVENIHPEELDLRCGSSCVLGQVYGEYERGMDKLGIKGYNRDMVEGVKYGFFADEGMAPDNVDDPWDLLTEAWVNAIEPLKAHAT